MSADGWLGVFQVATDVRRIILFRQQITNKLRTPWRFVVDNVIISEEKNVLIKNFNQIFVELLFNTQLNYFKTIKTIFFVKLAYFILNNFCSI